MLFVKSKTRRLNIDREARILLIKTLNDQGLVPLIRSLCLEAFEQVLKGTEFIDHRELDLAQWTAMSGGAAYVTGDVFSSENSFLFLIFEDEEEEQVEARAGIIYTLETAEPLAKLDSFCRQIEQALKAMPGASIARDSAEWLPHEQPSFPRFARFAAKSLKTPLWEETTDEQRRALELLEDEEARCFLGDVRNNQIAGRRVEYPARNSGEPRTRSLATALLDAGLLRRKVLVSCRGHGHVLFRLPTLDALSLTIASNATCNECGAPVVEEKIEDLIEPTEFASAVLEDGRWLAKRLCPILMKFGISEEQIAVAPASVDGETHMMVNVCGELFLLVLKCGDLTMIDAQRALGKRLEVGALHLVLVATGQAHANGLSMLAQARQRASRGSECEIILVDGVEEVDAVVSELYDAFSRVSQRALAKELERLDDSFALSIGYLIATAFRVKGAGSILSGRAEPAGGALIQRAMGKV
jgi:hypothetical protein